MSTLRPARTRLPSPADRLPFGAADLRVSPFCIGHVDEPGAIAAAFDAGINFFFVTTDLHWPVYEGSRRGLEQLLRRRGGVRDRIVVAAACYATQPEFCTSPFEELLEAVPGLERLDVLIAGGAYSHEFMLRLPVYEEHRRVRFLGARAIGTTFHDRRLALSAVRGGLVDAAFIRYNPDHSGARGDLFPHLPEGGRTLLLNFKSVWRVVGPTRCCELGVGDDCWRPRPTDYYRFALARPEIDGVLCAPRTPAQVQELLRALEEGALSPEQERYLLDLADLDQGRAKLDSSRDP
jgi:hypothetical protein